VSTTPTTHTLVIGAGQAGLAMSRCLTDAAIDHVVLERGQTAERWRSVVWDSLRLLTPNWATRLPGWSYQGPAPDGYMSAVSVTRYLSDYARSFAAPVEEGADVLGLRQDDGGFRVDTAAGSWRAGNVVVATGWCDQPRVPSFADQLDPGIAQITPNTYRNPSLLPDGRVLVVGASATGVQIADELARAGRPVVLAAGRHSRVPRLYRGMDIWWWLDRIGTFSRTIDETRDPVRARDVDLPALQRLGVRLTGHLTAVDGTRLTFADDLTATTGAADGRLESLLTQIDGHISATGLDGELLEAAPLDRLRATEPVTRLDAGAAGIGTVVWATGYRRSYPWLQVPVLDERGEIIQRRGVTPVDGLYVLGQRFQHRRDSNFIDGVRHDAAYVTGRIAELPQVEPEPSRGEVAA
jgi:putative flavoprotein involved in K+ transport